MRFDMLAGMLMLCLVVTTSGWSPALRRPHFGVPSTRNSISIRMANLLDTAKALQGLEILWGQAGVRLGYKESDIKGSDNFGRFCQAIEANGLAGELQSDEYTLLLPVDSAFDDFRGEITADIVRYHMIPGRKRLDSLNSDQLTAQGSLLKCAPPLLHPSHRALSPCRHALSSVHCES